MRTLSAAAFVALACASASAQFLPPGAERWTFLGAGGVPHYVMEVGEARAPGDTVVVVHGGFGAEHSYLIDPLLPLADRYRFVFYDQRGSLRSAVPPEADSLLAFPAFVEDLEALRLQLGTDRLTLLAHSMGALVSYGYLDRYPDRVRGVALVGPSPPTLAGSFGEPPDDPRLVPPEDSARVRALFRRHAEETERRLEAALARESFPDPDTLSPEALRTTPGAQKAAFNRYRIATAAYSTCRPERWRELRGVGRAFFSQRVADAVFSDANLPALEDAVDRMLPALEAYGGPVAIVQGDCDYLDPGATIAGRLARRVPGARVRVLPDAGHLPWIDAPEATAEALAWALGYAAGDSRE